MGQIFLAIEVLLKLLKLWDAFLLYMGDMHLADIQARQQVRNQAIEESKKADSDADIWKSQDGIVNNRSQP